MTVNTVQYLQYSTPTSYSLLLSYSALLVSRYFTVQYSTHAASSSAILPSWSPGTVQYTYSQLLSYFAILASRYSLLQERKITSLGI